jgi:hypothetical protein
LGSKGCKTKSERKIGTFLVGNKTGPWFRPSTL